MRGTIHEEGTVRRETDTGGVGWRCTDCAVVAEPIRAYTLSTSVEDGDAAVKVRRYDAATLGIPCNAGGGRICDRKLNARIGGIDTEDGSCLLYTSPSPRDRQKSRMPSSA